VIALASAAWWTLASGTPPSDVHLLPCPLKTVTGLPCPGCGMTRACLSLARGELEAAWTYHPFAFPLVPLATGVALWPRGTRVAWARVPELLRRVLLGGGIVLCLLLWISRLA